MRENPASGLAAPQVGVNQRIFVYFTNLEECQMGYKYSKETKLRIFVNPKILKKSTATKAGLEGCLSVPALHGVVHRPKV